MSETFAEYAHRQAVAHVEAARKRTAIAHLRRLHDHVKVGGVVDAYDLALVIHLLEPDGESVDKPA